MKKIINTLWVVLLMNTSSFGQSPDWQWAKSAGGTEGDAGHYVATDTNGNVYVTGFFSSPTITVGTTTLTNAGKNDMIIVKYDGTGNVIWAKSAGGAENEWGFGVATDGAGNVYVTGSYSSPSITFGTTTFTNPGLKGEFYLVKYDQNGNVLWAKKTEGNKNSAYGNGVSTDANGNVFVTGSFGGGPITFGTTTLINAGNFDLFIAKYDYFGNVVWAKSAGGTLYDAGMSITTDINGSVFIAGGFHSSSIIFNSTQLTNSGNAAVFIVKYDGSGNVLWAKSSSVSNSASTYGITTDINGNAFITGCFNSPSITFGSKTLMNSGNSDDIFIAKYDGNGNVSWAKSYGGNLSDCGNSITTDANGYVYVTGSFSSSSISFDNNLLTKVDGSDMFIVKYDGNGNVYWAKSTGGLRGDGGKGVATDKNGNVFVTGGCEYEITFGTTNLTMAGSCDMFVAKLNSTSGIDETVTNKRINVYPNPFTNKATLQVNDNLHNATLTIENFLGQEVEQVQNINGQTITLNRRNLPNGVYLLRLTEGNKIIVSEKIVIKD